MKKIYLILFLLTIAIGIYAQSGTYTANGVTWKYKLEGSPLTATITGETIGKDNFTGVLNIPTNIEHGGNSYSVTKIGDYAFENYEQATGLVLPVGIKIIGLYSFYRCGGVRGALNIPNGVTEIDFSAFAYCDKLTGPINFPNTLIEIEAQAFQSCTNLEGVLNIPSSLTTIKGNTFQFCEKLTKINIPNSVTTIGDMAFWDCIGLSKIEIPSSVTTIGSGSFGYCLNVNTPLIIPENVTTIGDMAFYKNSNMPGALTIPNSVTTIGNKAFQDCTSLSGPLTMGNSVTSIGSEAFLNCSGLTGALSLPNVTLVNYQAFMNCTGLTSLSMSKMERIEVEAFRGCTGLSGNINFPSSMRELGSRCFVGCTNLESITGENSLTSMFFNDQIFLGDYNLKYIDLSNVTVTPSTILSRDIASNSCFADLKPYTMVYLPQDAYSIAPNEENFVIGTTCDDFVAYDSHPDYKGGTVGCYFTIRNAFTAAQASYKNRSFSGETCKTICLPYPSTVPSGMIAYELREKTGSGGYFRFVSITGNQLAANTPYLLRITDSGTHTFGTETNVQVPVTPATIEVAASADGTTFFGGKTENIDNATAAAGGYYNLINNEWRPITTANPNGYVHSFRAYIRSTSPTPAKGFAIVLDDENETTGIGNMEEDIEKGDGKIYSLDGKLLGTDVDALKSGEIYIKNGKKFYKF